MISCNDERATIPIQAESPWNFCARRSLRAIFNQYFLDYSVAESIIIFENDDWKRGALHRPSFQDAIKLQRGLIAHLDSSGPRFRRILIRVLITKAHNVER